jgi:hypothetical protein
MTTDTKAVARFFWSEDEMDEDRSGDYVLFTDHERVVGDLQAARNHDFKLFALADENIANLRTALAASRAEVEGLRSVAIELRQELRDNALDAGQEPYNNPSANFVIDAAMEKGNG